MDRFAFIETVRGVFGFVARDSKLVATYLPQSRRAILCLIRERFVDVIEDGSFLPRFQRAVVSYYAGERVGFVVPVELGELPPYRRIVLEACRKVPYGTTASYADLARATNNPNASRAVGSSMANNPLPLVVPCHRILCSDGTVGGFSSPLGVQQKLQMLQLEGVAVEGMRRVGKSRSRVHAAKVA